MGYLWNISFARDFTTNPSNKNELNKKTNQYKYHSDVVLYHFKMNLQENQLILINYNNKTGNYILQYYN